MKRKGITPIIAIIVLLLITVALSGIAYTYISGVLTGQIEGSFIISTNGVYCENINDVREITIIIRNTGLTASLTADSFDIKRISGETTQYEIPAGDIPTIAPGQSGVIETDCGQSTGGCEGGINRVRLSTSANTQSHTVFCP